MTGPDGFLRLWDLCNMKAWGALVDLLHVNVNCWCIRHLGNFARKDLVLKVEGGKDKGHPGVQCWFNLHGVLW
jgi:hypothetical protein